MNGNATHLVPLPALSSTVDRAHAANSAVRRFDVERASRVAENPFEDASPLAGFAKAAESGRADRRITAMKAPQDFSCGPREQVGSAPMGRDRRTRSR